MKSLRNDRQQGSAFLPQYKKTNKQNKHTHKVRANPNANQQKQFAAVI